VQSQEVCTDAVIVLILLTRTPRLRYYKSLAIGLATP
jgi:hypothetical protein